MNNNERISFTLCGAVALSLCASVNAKEVATHSLDASEKILLMETINVTSKKEVAKEDETSGDPEVDQVLNLVDSLTLVSDEPTEEAAVADSYDESDRDSIDSRMDDATNIESSETDQNKDKLHTSDSEQSKNQSDAVERISDPKTDQTE